MNDNFASFFSSLPVMLNGMLGIFIVTGVIILTMYILNKTSEISAKKSKKNK